MSEGVLLPGIPPCIPPKPSNVTDYIEEIITGILNGGGLDLPNWLLYLLLSFYMTYIIKNLFRANINIRFRCVTRVSHGGHIEYGYCIYDANDRSATWLGFLYYGSPFYFCNIILDGIPTRCLVFSNSFDTTVNRPDYFNIDFTLLGIKLSAPLPNSYVWGLMSSSGCCTIKTNGYPLLRGIQYSRRGPAVIAVFIHGHRRDMSPVAL